MLRRIGACAENFLNGARRPAENKADAARAYAQYGAAPRFLDRVVIGT
ncbi:hypothetical protein [Caulobacter sp.]|nr:hypothetical protein [Caulobacter sp.]MBQ1561444.1 hypothetical protein [Caulobacter sp.]